MQQKNYILCEYVMPFNRKNICKHILNIYFKYECWKNCEDILLNVNVADLNNILDDYVCMYTFYLSKYKEIMLRTWLSLYVKT